MGQLVVQEGIHEFDGEEFISCDFLLNIHWSTWAIGWALFREFHLLKMTICIDLKYVGLGYLATLQCGDWVVRSSSHSYMQVCQSICGCSFFRWIPSFMCMCLCMTMYNLYVRISFTKTLEYIKNRIEQLPWMRIEYQFQTHLFFFFNK